MSDLEISRDTNQVSLANVAFYGRLLAHYQEIFGLYASELAGKRILDVASGPSLYPDTLWREHSAIVTAVDPLYAYPEEELLAKSSNDAITVTDAFRGTGTLDPMLEQKLDKDQLLHQTIGLSSSFAREFRANQSKSPPEYVADSLPDLKWLNNDKYDLVTCGHFLFAYFNPQTRPWLDEEFHQKSIQRMIELCSGEIRIYPIKTISNQDVPFLSLLLKQIQQAGHHVSIEEVPHAHVKYWNQMLRIIPYDCRSNLGIAHNKQDLWGNYDPWTEILI